MTKIKPEDAGLFEILDRVIDQGISFDAWLRVALPTTQDVRVTPAYVWTYLHFGEFVSGRAPLTVSAGAKKYRNFIG
jgi:hypothetical protein